MNTCILNALLSKVKLESDALQENMLDQWYGFEISSARPHRSNIISPHTDRTVSQSERMEVTGSRKAKLQKETQNANSWHPDCSALTDTNEVSEENKFGNLATSHSR